MLTTTLQSFFEASQSLQRFASYIHYPSFKWTTREYVYPFISLSIYQFDRKRDLEEDGPERLPDSSRLRFLWSLKSIAPDHSRPRRLELLSPNS